MTDALDKEAALREPVAWVFELAKARNMTTGEYVNFGDPQLSFDKPCVPEGSIRNLRPLRAAVPEGEPVAVKRGSDIEWLRFVKSGSPLYTHPAPRPDVERELAEARAEIERIHSLYGFEQRGRLTAEAERDALAADKARLVEALGKLEKAATVVSRHGAQTGHWWSDLTSGLIYARAALSRAALSAPAAPAGEAHPLARFGSPSVAPLGLYRVHWKSGGSSLAAIGMMENGDRWIAPTNWVRPSVMPSAGEWGEIERLEPIPAPADKCATCNGHGLIGAMVPWGDGQVDSVCEPCPDCSHAPADKAEARREALIEHLRSEFSDSYDCTRVWEAWSYNTMTEDDFEPITDRLGKIADGILALISTPGKGGRG